MSKIRFDIDDIKHIALFESMTGAKVKDFLRDGDSMCFVVKAGDMGLAIGKKGSKVEKVRTALGKTVMVVEFADEDQQFLRNLFHPVEVHELDIAGDGGARTASVGVGRGDRSKAIGQNGSRIKMARALAKRHFNIEDITLKTV